MNKKFQRVIQLMILTVLTGLFSMFTLSPGSITGREEALQLYREYYLPGKISGIDWNGSIDNCDAGELEMDILDKAEKRINYFRLACGLEPISLNHEYNELAQEAALIMTANGKLSHTPPSNWKCYSEKGFNGAQNSNLGYSDFDNFSETSFVTGFILDYGAANNALGHRKWLLNSRSLEMGYGNTGKFEAIYVIGIQQEAREEVPGFIAYPPAGYFPHELIYEKWSFAIPYGPEVDFSKAKVEMQNGRGEKLSVKILIKQDPWYYDPTLVWKAESLFTEEEIKYLRNSLAAQGYLDQQISVTIRDVLVNGEKKSYNYAVTPFDPNS